MAETAKPIRFSGHARQQFNSSGASEREVIEAINTEPWRPAEGGRLQCCKDFPFGAIWNQRQYATKQVRPIFVEEAHEIVVVTIYVYYF